MWTLERGINDPNTLPFLLPITFHYGLVNMPWVRKVYWSMCGVSSVTLVTKLCHGDYDLVCSGCLCFSENADFLFKFHMEALDWTGFDLCGISNSLPTTWPNGKTCLCWWWGTYRWWVWYDDRWCVWVCLLHIHLFLFFSLFLLFPLCPTQSEINIGIRF